MSDVHVALHPCGAEDLDVVARLVDENRRDLAAFRPYAAAEDDPYEHLEAYVREPGREACLVRVDDELAGFTMTRVLETTEREVVEFFVVRRWRRQGVGQQVAATMLRRHPGRWLVTHDEANAPAARFWPATIRSVADGEVAVCETGSASPYPGVEYRFLVGCADEADDPDTASSGREVGVTRGRIAGMSQVPAEGERTEEIVDLGAVTIEQIITGTPDPAMVYDQEQDEWVVVLDGHATLEVAGEQVHMLAGDWILLPARTRHRVLSAARGTRWIAVHHRPV
jgi:predicted acetyltransferase